MKKKLIAIGSAMVAAAVIIWAVNYIGLQRTLDEVIRSDFRNKGIVINAHYRAYVQPGVLVFDVDDVAGKTSPADVTRVLLDFAASQKQARFDTVELSYRGSTKFILSGSDFQAMGAEYGSENVVFTIRTLPEKLRNANGIPVFAHVSGGFLGVMAQQMQDFNDFHRQWWILDKISEQSSAR